MGVLALLVAVLTTLAPVKPTRLLVRWPAAGSTDAVMPAIATAAAKRLGQPIVIDHVPGASGTAALAKRAPADQGSC